MYIYIYSNFSLFIFAYLALLDLVHLSIAHLYYTTLLLYAAEVWAKSVSSNFVHSPRQSILKNYMFYFSFENSLCLDYVTEKFFEMLKYNMVPVVYASANYRKGLFKNYVITK